MCGVLLSRWTYLRTWWTALPFGLLVGRVPLVTIIRNGQVRRTVCRCLRLENSTRGCPQEATCCVQLTTGRPALSLMLSAMCMRLIRLRPVRRRVPSILFVGRRLKCITSRGLKVYERERVPNRLVKV